MLKLIISCLCLLFSSLPTVFAERVAIIGGGAAGVITAWLLDQDHEITLYESQPRLGGHANSIEVDVDGDHIIVEAGAEFFNRYDYTHFLRLLDFYHIPVRPFTLVTTFYDTEGNDTIILPPYHDGVVEWGSLTPYNLRRIYNLKTVLDQGHHVIQNHEIKPTLQEFADGLNVSEVFKDTFLYPFLAAGWGVPTEDIKGFSAYSVLQYMVDSNDNDSYEWLEVESGLSSYINKVAKSFRHTKVKLSAHVKSISYENGVYKISEEYGDTKEFDHLVLATNANIAAKLLRSIPEASSIVRTLAKVRYYDTKIAIHGDRRFMPAEKQDWRVVNIRYNGVNSQTTMYKKWKGNPVFKSWITLDVRAPDDDESALPYNIYALITYQHPYTDHYFFDAQEKAQQVQGNNNLWFAGMWMYDIGSHEHAIISAMNIAERLAPNSDRLKILNG